VRELRDGDFAFANEWNAVARGALQGTCVVSGCGVSDGGSNDFALDVASGTVVVDGVEYAIGAQSVTLDAADADHDRYDLVVVGTDGAAEVVAGQPGSSPYAPSIPDDHVLLAVVAVAAGTGGVTDADVYDARAVFGHMADTDAHHDRYTNTEAREQALAYDIIGV
jgi:hypothetical protein